MNVNSNLPWTFRRIAARLEGVAGWDVFTGIGSYIAKNDAEWLIVPNTDPRAAAQAADEDGEPIDIRGTLDVDLALSGSVAGNENRLGRGTLELRDGRYYRLPLLMAIWNYVNLNVRTPPGGHAFDRAAVRFLINGDIMEIEEITLDGPGMTLKGGGRMSIPDRHLDLVDVCRQPLPRLDLVVTPRGREPRAELSRGRMLVLDFACQRAPGIERIPVASDRERFLGRL